jgi:hypothetical protein
LAEVGDTAHAPTAFIYWLKSAILGRRQPLLFIGRSRRYCAGANRFYLLAEVGDTAQAPTASIYWLKSAILRRRQPLLFIGSSRQHCAGVQSLLFIG